MRPTPFILGSIATMLIASSAFADAPSSGPNPSDEPVQHTIDRTWLYADDARVAAPLTVVATTSVSYTNVSNDPSRILNPTVAPAGCTAPCNAYQSFANNTATPGALVLLGGEIGVLPRLSVIAVGQVALGTSPLEPNASIGAQAGVRVRLSPETWKNLHIMASGGYLREAWQGPAYDDDTNTWHPGSPNGANGAWLQAAIAGDIGRFRLAGSVLGEHVFADYRDPLDIMVQAGANVRVVGPFRAGVEYVGQDLEEIGTPGAEGGARHLVGPVASLQLLDQRLSLVTGPAIGLSAQTPTFAFRFGASFGF
jgi:hypothetical protein